MADFYALPTLTQWSGGGVNSRVGWSNTSGGPNIGTNAALPSYSDRVFFDANSGPSREINVLGGIAIGFWSTVGAAPMTFTGTGYFTVYSPPNVPVTLNLTGTVRVDPAINFSPISYSYTDKTTLIAPGVSFKDIQIRWHVTFASDLKVRGDMSFMNNYEESPDGSVYYYPYVATFTGNVDVYALRWDAASGGSVYMGSGTWTINTGHTMFLYTTGNIVPQGCTLVIDLVTQPGSGWYFNTANKNYHAKFKRTAGPLTIPNYYFNNLLSWSAEPGCSFILDASVYTMGEYNLRGFPDNRITLITQGSSQLSMLKTSNASTTRITFDFCNITRVNSSPVGLIYGRGCTLVNTNIIPYFAAPGFASFF